MRERNYVDISFTVKESELAGRRLLRDLDTGQMFYDPPEPDAAELALPVPEPFEIAPVVEQAIREDEKARKPRRKARSEGDK